MPALVPLESHQTKNMPFPVNCSVTVYDGQVPACIVSHGTVLEVLLKTNHPIQLFWRVETTPGLIQLVPRDRLRLQSGCRVNVDYHDSYGNDAQMKTAEGVVLGSIDMLSRGSGPSYAYWVKLIATDDDNSPKILHELNPSQVSYRPAEDDGQVANMIEDEEEDNEEDADDAVEDDQKDDLLTILATAFVRSSCWKRRRSLSCPSLSCN